MNKLALTVAFILLTAPLAGCHGKQAKQGDAGFHWPWDEPEIAPLAATRIEVSRFDVPDPREPGVDRSEGQRFVVDLETGEAELVDTDGRHYHQMFSMAEVRPIREALADRTWMLDPAKYPRPLADVRMLELGVYDAGGRVGQPVRWVRPGYRDQELPVVFARIENLFDRAHRRVYPLSRNIDLIR